MYKGEMQLVGGAARYPFDVNDSIPSHTTICKQGALEGGGGGWNMAQKGNISEAFPFNI